jgi:hypothetical protein
MSQAKTVKEVLIATEWILNRLEWCQGAFYLDDKGESSGMQGAKACCLSGALYLVNTTDELREVSRRHLQNIGFGGLVSFNDAPGRTKQQVLELVMKGIERAL